MSKPPLLSRKKARRLALQALYSWLVSENDINTVERYFLVQHENESFDKEYFHTVLFEVAKQAETLDEQMKPYLSRRIDELDYIEHSLLRLALYELKDRPEIPYRVVINEALELAKTFGAAESYKFINGVLDKMLKDGVRQDCFK